MFAAKETEVKKALSLFGQLHSEKVVWPGPNILNRRRGEFLGRLRGRHFLKARVLKT